jgi:Inner membrane component of T3SS, cytoplasmic domain
MEVRCGYCGAQIDLQAAAFASGSPAQVHCWMCSRTSEVEKPADGPPEGTIVVKPVAARDRPFVEARLDESFTSQTKSLSLPKDAAIAVCVTAGPAKGLECELTRPLVTIGRRGGGADIEIDDAEISRLHCSVEVKRDVVLLHDLRSTNGTYVGERRILSARLENQSEFRIGSSILRVRLQVNRA